MRINTKHARHGRLAAAFLLLLALSVGHLALATGPARANEATIEEAGSGGDVDRWWGVLGAALCGAEIRLIIKAPAIGMNPYALAAGIAGCTLAVLDVMTTE